MALHGTIALAQTHAKPTVAGHEYAPWQLLNQAYNMRDDRIIDKYARVADGSSRLYAQELQALTDENIDKLQEIGRSCMTYHVKTDDDATALFGCLFAASAGSKLYINVKSHFIWLANLKIFYNRHKRAIDRATKTNSPANIDAIKVPDVGKLKNWPTEKFSINKDWKDIPLHNGTVDGFVDGVQVRFTVDTGTSAGIYLSSVDIRRLGIEKHLVSLGASFDASDNTGGAEVSLFYAKHFRVGPIRVQNVYIDVGPGSSSYIGLHLLRKLRKFSVSAHKISRTEGRVVACGSMRWVRMPVTQAFSYPFLSIHINDNLFGLFLDSGMHLGTQKGDSDIYVPSRGASILRQDASAKHRQAGDVVMVQHGKVIKFQSERFDANIGTLSLSAWTVPSVMFVSDPAVDGALAYGFLKRGFVYYDFVNRRMCIGRSNG